MTSLGVGDAPDRLRLRAHLRALRRRWLLVVVVLLLVVGGALAWSLTRQPQYRASTDVVIEPTTADVSQSTTGEITDEEVATQVRVATSVAVAALVQEKLGLDEAPALVESVVVEPVGASRIMRITSQAPDAEAAAALADAVAASYLEDRSEASRQLYDETTGLLTSRQGVISEEIRLLDEQLATGTASNQASLYTQRQTLMGQLGQISTELSSLEVAAGGGTNEGGQIITRAEVPEVPASPRPVINGLLAALVGLILGIAAALTRDRFDDVVYEPEAVRHALGRWPLLATIPKWDDVRFDQRLVSVLAPHSAAGEAFGGLGVNVRFLLSTAGAGEGPAIASVISARTTEGKTTVAANLAVAVASVGLRVVLVDADLRRGTLVERFGLDPGLPGLSDLLIGADESVEPIDVGIENLRILPGGTLPPNPTELLASSRMRTVLGDLGKAVDVIILDVPPVIVADGLELLDVVDLSLLVTRRGVSHRRELRGLVDRMEQLGARSVAAVLTGAQAEESTGQTYAYEGPPGAAS